MAGISDSSSIRPWIQADVFIFSKGVPEDPSQVQTLGTPPPTSPQGSQGPPFLLPRRPLSLVTQVGPWGQQTLWSSVVGEGGPRTPPPPHPHYRLLSL